MLVYYCCGLSSCGHFLLESLKTRFGCSGGIRCVWVPVMVNCQSTGCKIYVLTSQSNLMHNLKRKWGRSGDVVKHYVLIQTFTNVHTPHQIPGLPAPAAVSQLTSYSQSPNPPNWMWQIKCLSVRSAKWSGKTLTTGLRNTIRKSSMFYLAPAKMHQM